MCSECPDEVRALARDVGLLMARNNWHDSGGLHIVIDDENVESDHIQWCIDQGMDEERTEIARRLLAMDAPYRHAVLDLADDGAAIANGQPVFEASWDES